MILKLLLVCFAVNFHCNYCIIWGFRPIKGGPHTGISRIQDAGFRIQCSAFGIQHSAFMKLHFLLWPRQNPLLPPARVAVATPISKLLPGNLAETRTAMAAV